MSSFKTKIGALLIKKSLKEELKTLDATEYGGAPLIGLNIVVKGSWQCHIKRDWQCTYTVC